MKGELLTGPFYQRLYSRTAGETTKKDQEQKKKNFEADNL